MLAKKKKRRFCLCPDCLQDSTRGRSREQRSRSFCFKYDEHPESIENRLAGEKSRHLTGCLSGGRPKKRARRTASHEDKEKLRKCISHVNGIHSDCPWKERWCKVAKMFFSQKKVSKRRTRWLYDFYRRTIRRVPEPDLKYWMDAGTHASNSATKIPKCGTEEAEASGTSSDWDDISLRLESDDSIDEPAVSSMEISDGEMEHSFQRPSSATYPEMSDSHTIDMETLAGNDRDTRLPQPSQPLHQTESIDTSGSKDVRLFVNGGAKTSLEDIIGDAPITSCSSNCENSMDDEKDDKCRIETYEDGPEKVMKRKPCTSFDHSYNAPMDIETLPDKNVCEELQQHKITNDLLSTGSPTSATAATTATISVSAPKLNESNEPDNAQCQLALKSLHRDDVFKLTDYVSGICSKIACDIANMCIIGGQDQSGVNPRDSERKGTQATEIASTCLDGPLRKTLIEESNTRVDENHSKVTNNTGKQPGTFADIGISAETLSMLCESNVPSDGIFKASLPKDVNVKLPDDWQKHLGKDKLIGNWCDLLVGIIKQHNQYCTLVFKGNYVSSLESRKRNCALVRGHAVCAHQPICTAEVHFLVTKSDLNTMHLQFRGEITHNVRNTRARHISGLAREQKRQIFEKNLDLPQVYFVICNKSA